MLRWVQGTFQGICLLGNAIRWCLWMGDRWGFKTDWVFCMENSYALFRWEPKKFWFWFLGWCLILELEFQIPSKQGVSVSHTVSALASILGKEYVIYVVYSFFYCVIQAFGISILFIFCMWRTIIDSSVDLESTYLTISFSNNSFIRVQCTYLNLVVQKTCCQWRVNLRWYISGAFTVTSWKYIEFDITVKGTNAYAEKNPSKCIIPELQTDCLMESKTW